MSFSKTKKTLLSLAYGLMLTIIAWQCYEKPLYNADILPYMAIVLSMGEEDLGKVHQQTYSIAQQQIPTLYYDRLIDPDHAFRNEIKNDVNKFFQNVSFFKIKPLYNLCIFIFYEVGAPLVKAIIWPSVLSFVFITALVSYWLNHSTNIFNAFLISLGIAISPPVLEAARLSTPDSLSTAFVLLSFYFMFRNCHWSWIAIALSISIAIRLDNIILAFLSLIFHHIHSTKKRQGILLIRESLAQISMLMVWTLYGIFIMRFANYNEALEKAFTTLWITNNPFKEAINGMTTIQFSYIPPVMIFCGVIVFAKKIESLRSLNYRQWFFIMISFYVIIKYLAFPNLTTRFYLPIYIVAIIIMIEEFMEVRTSKATSS